MLSKSKFLKTALLAALVGLAGAAAVTPASARDYDRGHDRGYHRDRDSGWGRDRGYEHRDHGGRGDWSWNRYRHHRHNGWY